MKRFFCYVCVITLKIKNMRKIIYLLVLVYSYGYSQETEFTFTKDGFTDYVVTECQGKTAPELYKKVIDWVFVSYKNPKEVLLAQIDNDYVRIEGIKDGLVSGYMGTTFPVKYQIEISLKDNKYKFDLLSVEYYVNGNQYGSGGWRNYELNDVKNHYKSSGEVKSKYENEHTTFPAYFNELNNSLKDFILNQGILSKKKDW